MKNLIEPPTERSAGSTERLNQQCQEDGTESSRTSIKDRSKRLRIFKNGDVSFGGKQVIINGRSTRNMEVLMSQLTQHLDATVAVRSLHTPTHGTKVTSIDQLNDKSDYVAVNSGPFKKMNYSDLREKVPLKFSNKTASQTAGEAPRNKLVVPGRIRETATGSLTIFVFSNGIPTESPTRITFPLKTLDQWPSVLNEVNHRMRLRGKDAKALYTLDGKRLLNSFDLEQGGQYVAVGVGVRGFVKANYGEAVKPSFYVPINRDATRKNVWNAKTMDKWRNKPGVSISSPNSSDFQSLSSNSEGSENFRRIGRNKKLFHNSDGNFYAKQRHKNYDYRNVNYDEDAGGVFRAKKQRNETKYAQAIIEDVATRIDFPAEMIGADDVEDEIEYMEEEDGKQVSNDLRAPVNNDDRSTYRKSYEKDK